jgi:hypothetical protein
VREDEFSHKGIDRTVQINRAIIDSNEYRRKFDNATDNPLVNKTLYTSSREILYDRSGTYYESMYWIDLETGEVITKFTSMGNVPHLTGKDHELKVEYPDGVLHKIRGYNKIAVIHNHPNSSAPSVGDFNSAFMRGYTVGFIAAHDGRVFKYSSNIIISEEAFDFSWQKYRTRGYDDYDAQILTINKYARNNDITFEEVLRK